MKSMHSQIKMDFIELEAQREVNPSNQDEYTSVWLHGVTFCLGFYGTACAMFLILLGLNLLTTWWIAASSRLDHIFAVKYKSSLSSNCGSCAVLGFCDMISWEQVRCLMELVYAQWMAVIYRIWLWSRLPHC